MEKQVVLVGRSESGEAANAREMVCGCSELRSEEVERVITKRRQLRICYQTNLKY